MFNYIIVLTIFVTRKVAKSVVLPTVVALLVILSMGLNEVFADHEQDRLLEDFGELLDGVETSLFKTQGEVEPVIDQSSTLRTDLIASQIAHLKAFDEVIQKQIF